MPSCSETVTALAGMGDLQAELEDALETVDVGLNSLSQALVANSDAADAVQQFPGLFQGLEARLTAEQLEAETVDKVLACLQDVLEQADVLSPVLVLDQAVSAAISTVTASCRQISQCHGKNSDDQSFAELQVDVSEPQANHEADAASSSCAELFLQLSEMLDRCQQSAEELSAAGDLLGQARASITAEQADEDSSAGQLTAGLDDILMCLAELQLQQEGAASCCAALGKACSCVSKLQDSLAGDMCNTSSCYKLAMEGQAAWRTSVIALRNSSYGVSAVRRSVSGLLDAATADSSFADDDSLQEVLRSVQEASARLDALQRQQYHELQTTCPAISSTVEAVALHCRTLAGTSGSGISSGSSGGQGTKLAGGRPSTLTQPTSPRPSSRLGRMSATSSPRGERAASSAGVVCRTRAAASPETSNPSKRMQDAATQAMNEHQGDAAELLVLAHDEAALPCMATRDTSAGGAVVDDAPCSTGSVLQELDGWQELLLQLQVQLHGHLQGSKATCAEQLQEVCQALLQLSTQLQQGHQEKQDRLSSSTGVSKEGVLLAQVTPSGHAMRRWSNPVFSTSIHEHPQDPRMQPMTSARPMNSSAGFAPAGSTAHSNPTYQAEDLDLRRCSSSNDELPVWTNMPKALAASAAAAAAAANDAEAAAAADNIAVTASPVGAAVSDTATGSDDSHPCCCEQQPQLQLVAVGPVSVFREDCTADEELSPHCMPQLPLPGDRLPPCELQDCSAFAPLPPEAAVSAQALDDLLSGQKKGLQLRAVLSSQLPAAADNKVAVKAALTSDSASMLRSFSPAIGSMGVPLSVHAAAVDRQSFPSGYFTMGDVFDGLTKQQPIKPATAQLMRELSSPAHKPSLHLQDRSTFSDALQQLLRAVQHAGSVLGPAALAALQSCNTSLAAVDLAVLHSAASTGVQDAARVQDTLLELATQLSHMLAAQQSGDAGAAAASMGQQGALHAGAAAAAGVASVPWRQDTHQSWTIAAMHEGHRWSFSSHGSGSHHIDTPTSPRFTSGGGVVAQQLPLDPSQGGDPLQPETMEAADAELPDGVQYSGCDVACVDAPASAAGAAPEQPQGVGSQGRMPSLDLFEAEEAPGGLDEGNSMFFATAAVDGAAVAAAVTDLAVPEPMMQCAAASTTALAASDPAVALGSTAACCQEGGQSGVAELPVQHSTAELFAASHLAAVAPQLSLLGTRLQSAPGAIRRSTCGDSSPGGLLYDTIMEQSPREHRPSCIPPALRKAVKGIKKQLHHSHSHAGRPTEDLVDSMGSHSSGDPLQQQVLLIWSLRDQLAAAERKLQQYQEQHEHSYHTNSHPSRHGRAATVDEVLIRPTQLNHSSSTAAAATAGGAIAGSRARRNTCDTAVLARPRSTSPGPIASVQHALKHFLAVTSRPSSPAKVVGSVRLDGGICIEAAGSSDLQHSTASDMPSQAYDRTGSPEHTTAGTSAEPTCEFSTAHCASDCQCTATCGQAQAMDPNADETAECCEPQPESEQPLPQQQPDHQLLQELQSVQQQRQEAEALHTAVQQECEATKQQLHGATHQVLQLQEQLTQIQQELAASQAAQMVLEVRHLQSSKREAAAVMDACRVLESAAAGAQQAGASLSKKLQEAREHLSQQQQAASELQEQLLTAQQQQWGAEDACAQMQAQQDHTQQQLLLVQQHEKELEQQLQDWEAAAVLAQEAAAKCTLQEQGACSDGASQEHSSNPAVPVAAQEGEAAALQQTAEAPHTAEDTAIMSAAAANSPALNAATPTTQDNTGLEPEGEPVQTAACQDTSERSQAQYSEQVIQQLAGEVDRLLTAQAAMESLHGQLDAATERNTALQAEVDSLTAALALAHQHAAAEAAAEAGAHQQGLFLERLEQQLEQEHTHAEQEHAMVAVLQQQLERSSADAASAHAHAAELQAELRALQESNTELKAQLLQLTTTLADLEAATSRPQVYSWPPRRDSAVSSQHKQQQEQARPVLSGQSTAASAAAVTSDGAAQAALVKGLSDALNKQAELQELLQQRDRQLQALTSQLCSSDAGAADTVLPAAALALGLPFALLHGVQGAEQVGSMLTAQQPGSSAGQHSTLAAEVAAMLATSPPKGYAGPAVPAVSADVVLLSSPGGSTVVLGDETATCTAVATDDQADSTAVDVASSMPACTAEEVAFSSDACEGCGSGGSWCSEDGVRQHSASSQCGQHAPQHLEAASGIKGHNSQPRHAEPQGAEVQAVGVSTQQHIDGTGLVTWGSREGRLTPLARQSGSITQARPATPIPELPGLQAACAGQGNTSSQPSAEVQMHHIDSLEEAAAADDVRQTHPATHTAAAVPGAESASAAAGGAAVSNVNMPDSTPISTGCAESEAYNHRVLCVRSSAGADHGSPAHSMAAFTVVLGGCSDAVELPPSTEVSRMHEMSLGLPECGSVVPDFTQYPWHQLSDSEDPMLEQGTQLLGLQETAAAPHGHVSSATAAAVATHLLAAARAAAARATAAEAQQQQAAEELVLQHDIQELQHRELTLLKQRLAASEAEAAGLGTRLQTKQQQLQQVQAKLRKLQQQQELQAQEVPSPSHQLFSRTGGYASAAAGSRIPVAPAAAGRASERPTAQSNSTKQDSTPLITPAGTRKGAAGPANAATRHAHFHATSYFEVGSSGSSPHAGNTAAKSTHINPVKTPSSCHADSAECDDTAVSCPQRSSTPQLRTSCSKLTAAGPGGKATLRKQFTASSPAAAGSPAHVRKQLAQAGSPAASPAGLARSPHKGSVLSWSAELQSPSGAAAQGQELVYQHAEEMRRLARELVVKERSIATLRASNKLHKQQLQQLAQSAAQAGLQVTPQRLLHIADEPNSPAGHDSGSSSRYAALLEADSAITQAPAAAVTKHYTAAESGDSPVAARKQQPAGESPVIGSKQQPAWEAPSTARKQQPAGRPGSAVARPAGGSSFSITPLAGFMQGAGSPSKQQDDSGAAV